MNTYKDEIIGNLKEFYLQLSERCGYETGAFSDLKYAWNREGSWPAYIIGQPDEGKLQDIVDKIDGHELPPFWIMEQDPPAKILSFLDSQNIRVIRNWKGMILDPDSLPATIEIPEDLEMHINKPKDLPAFISMINRDLLSGSEMEDELSETIKDSDDMDWIVAYESGRPVSAGLLFTYEGVAGLYMIVTASERRGMGYGSAVTIALVDLAIKRGIRKMVLHATPMGEGIYAKYGFKPVMDMPILWKLGY